MRAKISGAGMYVPERCVPNEELLERFECSEEWIIQRSGIRTRHWVTTETPADLAEFASRAALERSNRSASEIDCIILATLSPQAEFPGTSFFLQRQLGLEDTPCFDLRAPCSGFIFSLSVAKGFIESGQFERILVVGCELQSRGLDMTPEGRDVAVLFGDGAGAVIVEASSDKDNERGLLEIRLHAQGKFAEKLWTEAPGCALNPRISQELGEEKRHYPKMMGRMVFRHAVRRMPEVLLETLSAAESLVKEGFTVLPYINADPVLAKRLEDAGAATVMPLGAPIGSNRGLATRDQIEIIIEQANVPVVVDAGIGAPSHAAEAMEMGADAVLVNTAIAVAGDPVAMAGAFRAAVEAGRTAFGAGLPNQSERAEATSPLTGFLDE